MKFFEYPYVIITILAIIFLVVGFIGLYFIMKSVKTAKGTSEKGFCGIGRIENDFDKAGLLRKNRTIGRHPAAPAIAAKGRDPLFADAHSSTGWAKETSAADRAFRKETDPFSADTRCRQYRNDRRYPP